MDHVFSQKYNSAWLLHMPLFNKTQAFCYKKLQQQLFLNFNLLYRFRFCPLNGVKSFVCVFYCYHSCIIKFSQLVIVHVSCVIVHVSCMFVRVSESRVLFVNNNVATFVPLYMYVSDKHGFCTLVFTIILTFFDYLKIYNLQSLCCENKF